MIEREEEADNVLRTFRVTLAATLAVLGSAPLATAAVIERVSVATTGDADAMSCCPDMTPDARFVAFASDASNLVPGVGGFRNVYLRDRASGTTVHIGQGFWPRVSDDASVITADDPWFNRVVAFDRSLGTARTVAPAAWAGAISGNSRVVSFLSTARLVADDLNGLPDVYTRDLATGVFERVSIGVAGAGANEASTGNTAISRDGRFVAFMSLASNLVVDDANGAADVFVRDRLLAVTERVSVTSDGSEGAGSSGARLDISADGRVVVFNSFAALTPDAGFLNVYLRDRATRSTELVAGFGTGPTVSDDGMRVAYENGGVWVWDRSSRGAQLASLNAGGTANDPNSFAPALSGDGALVAFYSNASDLVDGDLNGQADVFVAGVAAPPPPPPPDPLGELQARVAELTTNRGIHTSLRAKLNAFERLRTGDHPAACLVLGAFGYEVGALAGTHLASAEADELTALVTAVASENGC